MNFSPVKIEKTYTVGVQNLEISPLASCKPEALALSVRLPPFPSFINGGFEWRMGKCVSGLWAILARMDGWVVFIGTFWRCGENLECFGAKMSEIREFIGWIFRNPRYWSRATGICSRSAHLPDGAERIFRVWSRAISDLARDPLKKFSALTCVDREQKIAKARDPSKILYSLTWCWSRAA